MSSVSRCHSAASKSRPKELDSARLRSALKFLANIPMAREASVKLRAKPGKEAHGIRRSFCVHVHVCMMTGLYDCVRAVNVGAHGPLLSPPTRTEQWHS
jgi:hypothetical protein